VRLEEYGVEAMRGDDEQPRLHRIFEKQGAKIKVMVVLGEIPLLKGEPREKKTMEFFRLLTNNFYVWLNEERLSKMVP
jgi:hypothetical protein